MKLPVIFLALATVASVGLTPTAATALPETMRAAAIDQGGDAESLSIHTVPRVQPKTDQVLIAVSVAGVGVWQAKYRPEDAAHFPVILGSDGAGTVAAVGANVRGFKVGDQVYGTNGAFYAEYVAVSADNVAHLPKGMNFTEAGALGISGLSALQGVDDVLNLRSGDTLIIHGAAGAVGTLAVQFAKLRGARVLATVSDDAGAALVSRLGADEVINGRTGDIAAAARRLAPQGVDAVLGLAGGDALERCIDTVRRDRRGRVAYLYGMEPIPAPRFGIRMTLYSFVAGVQEFERLNEAVAAAKLQVPVAAEYPLAEAAAAHKRLAAGHLLGKVVLRVRTD